MLIAVWSISGLVTGWETTWDGIERDGAGQRCSSRPVHLFLAGKNTILPRAHENVSRPTELFREVSAFPRDVHGTSPSTRNVSRANETGLHLEERVQRVNSVTCTLAAVWCHPSMWHGCIHRHPATVAWVRLCTTCCKLVLVRVDHRTRTVYCAFLRSFHGGPERLLRRPVTSLVEGNKLSTTVPVDSLVGKQLEAKPPAGLCVRHLDISSAAHPRETPPSPRLKEAPLEASREAKITRVQFKSVEKGEKPGDRSCGIFCAGLMTQGKLVANDCMLATSCVYG